MLTHIKVMKKFVKICLISFCVIFGACVLSSTLFLGITLIKFSSLALNEEALSSPMLAVAVYDSDNRPVKDENTFNSAHCSISQLPENVKNAFIAIEDVSFYKHHGLNYKRICKAALKNITTHSLKEGASTISQQLIKNTHLSSEKTFERKIKEIVLTKKLEKSHSKDQILECYLNAIYYGNNCYGIENAANYYFSKSSNKLNLQESALLAGMIKSPNRYSPISQTENALKRRNLVLRQMQKAGFISEEDAENAAKSEIELNLSSSNLNPINSYSEAALDEAKSILNIPLKDIALNGYKIHTYLNLSDQQKLEKALEKEDFNSADHAAILVDNSKHAVSAFLGKSAYKILTAKRQPGSAIKPILVYAPALDADLIYPCSQILDEPLSLGEYKPKNVDGKFRGYVSASEAVSKSINIPAIKVLSYVGVERAKSYAESMGIDFDDEDTSLALALGGMRYGVSLKQMAQAYSTFACGGKYAEAKFVEYITDAKGKILYKHSPQTVQAIREDTAYLMTTMLQEAAESGTAKNLASLEMAIAAKTGTVGKGKKNSDAWCVAYTPEKVCAVWVGNLDNTPISVAGGNQPTRCAKNYFESAKEENRGAIVVPSTIVTRDIDLVSLENEHRIELASPATPERFRQSQSFSVFNLPKDVSSNFLEVEKQNFDVKFDGKTASISFKAKRNYIYKIYDSTALLKEVSGQNEDVALSLDFSGENVKIVYGFDEKNCQVFECKIKNETPKIQPIKKRRFFV